MAFLYNLFRATEDENRRAILAMLPVRPDARLLDLGCYEGAWSMELAKKVGTSRVTGVEVVDEAADKARSRGMSVVKADLNGPIPLPDGSFDIIHANQVIEHLYDTDRFVCEIKRLLSKDGCAIISTNNLASLHNIVSLLSGSQPPPCHVSNRIVVGNQMNPLEGAQHENAAMAHLRIFSYRALRAFLKSYGLKTDLYRTVGFYPFPIPLARVLARVFPVYGAFLTCRVRHA